MSDENVKFTPEDLEPGDKSEKQTGFDWCLAAGCAGCVDPVGCVNAIGQAFMGCFHGCLGQVGCGTFVLLGLVFGIYRLVVFFTN